MYLQRGMCKLFFFMPMDYTLLMQKMKDGSPVKDSLADFGVVCTEVPFMPSGETKELASNDWYDEDGEDTYIPDRLPMAAYDWEVGFCYKGNLSTCYSSLKALTDYLNGRDGSGAGLKVYSSYTGMGRQGVYLKSMSDFEFTKSNLDEVLTFTATFRVTDPVTDVVLTR